MAILEVENSSVSTSNWAQNMAATPPPRIPQKKEKTQNIDSFETFVNTF